MRTWDRQIIDAELAMKKSEAELANLRVQLQAQLLNEKALEAQLESDATQAKLEAERDAALLKASLGTEMNAKISRAKADSLATRLQIEREKLGIAAEARDAQLTAKQAEVAQTQALYSLRTEQKQALMVRAGMTGVLEGDFYWLRTTSRSGNNSCPGGEFRAAYGTHPRSGSPGQQH